MPRRIKPHRIIAGPLRGSRIVTSWHDYPSALLGRTERGLLQWLDQHVRQGETWIDVGAHYGYTALALCRRVGRAGRVVAFEPMVATAGHLATTRALNDLTQLVVVPVGLDDSASLRAAWMGTARGMACPDRSDGAATEFFLFMAFDALWSTLTSDDAAVHGVKIDAQGMEIAVLRGMANTLQRWRPKLVIEIHHGVDRRQLVEQLTWLGYPRRGVPVEGDARGEQCEGDQYEDDHSYAFVARVLDAHSGASDPRGS